MPNTNPSQFTALLAKARLGDEEANADLILFVYQDLRRLAQHYLKHERPDHTLQATALVHELYLRLFGENHPDWQDRSHFMIIAAQQMRRILIDHSRSAKAVKRNGNGRRVPLEEAALLPVNNHDVDLIALDDAMERFKKLRPRACAVVELRFFAGLTEEQVAKILGLSVTSIKREWNFAKAWLYDELQRGNRQD